MVKGTDAGTRRRGEAGFIPRVPVSPLPRVSASEDRSLPLQVQTGSAAPQEPHPHRQRNLRLWTGVHRLRGSLAAGRIVHEGALVEPHAGNPPPRICETPAGMLNAIGLQNIGVAAFLREKLPEAALSRCDRHRQRLGRRRRGLHRRGPGSRGRGGARGHRAEHLLPERREGRDALWQLPEATASLVARVREATKRPLMVKLSPNAPDLVESARAARDAGADVLSLINTFVAMAIDPETARPRLSFGTGGLSGPAIKPLAVRMVYQVARALPGTPLVGIGGISELADVLEFLAAGATAVQVGPPLQGSRRLAASGRRAHGLLLVAQRLRRLPRRPRALAGNVRPGAGARG